MTKDEAVKHPRFGTQEALAKALGMSQGSISLWKGAIPALRQLQIEALTGGELRADPECDRYRVPQLVPAPAVDSAPGALDATAEAT